MATGRGKNKEEDYRKQADQHLDNYKAGEYETNQTRRINKFHSEWDAGKDVGGMDYVKPFLDLYKGASANREAEQGMGVLGNNQLTGGNGQMAGLIGQQLQSRRQENASGMLYDAVNSAHSDSVQQGNFMAQMGDNRLGNKANMSQQRYTAYLNRPKKPSIWETLLQGGLAAGAAYAGRPG